jgi:hypothetical protein
MAADGSTPHRRTNPVATLDGRWIAAAVCLAVAGIILIWSALPGPSIPDPVDADAPPGHSVPTAAPSSTIPSRERTPAPAREIDVRDHITGLILAESHPVAITIPSIGVRSTLVDLGLDSSGALQTPPDPGVAGWFSRGASPGALGPAIIAGHVTWNRAPAVFYRLGSLRRGDRVAVTRKDGSTAVFIVNRVARFSKSRFPAGEVYGPIDHAGLRLITCGGTYDWKRHTYVDNVVVFARLEKVRKARS